MRKLDLKNGAVLSGPYELLDLIQAHANDNVTEVLDALFETTGVLSPNSDELAVSIFSERPYRVLGEPAFTGDEVPFNEPDLPDEEAKTAPDPPAPILMIPPRRREVEPVVKLVINEGFVLTSEGVVYNAQPQALIVDKRDWLTSLTTKTLYINAVYTELKDTPVQMMPHSRGRLNIRTYGDVRFEASETAGDGTTKIALAELTLNRLTSTIEDLRSDNAALLRADLHVRSEIVDPALKEDIEELFSRPNTVSELINLLDNGILRGGYVVTEDGPAADPVFFRYSKEPAIRELIRQLDGQGYRTALQPNSQWKVDADWNLYRLGATKLTSTTFEIDTAFDLTNITLGAYPLFLQYGGVDYEIDSFPSANVVEITGPAVGSPASDTEAAIHNGLDDFTFEALPSLPHQRTKGDRTVDFSLHVPEVPEQAPDGILLIPAGNWRLSLTGTGDGRRGTYAQEITIPVTTVPDSIESLSLFGEQRDIGIEKADTTFEPANPFSQLKVGSDGEPVIDTGQIDKYVRTILDETQRMQEGEVVLTAEVEQSLRTRGADTPNEQIVIGYNFLLEMRTQLGWVNKAERTVFREIQDLANELTWVDLTRERFRGTVGLRSDLTELSDHLGDLDILTFTPIMEEDVVRVLGDPTPANNGYWRYQPDTLDYTGLTTFPYSADGGMWVKVDITRETFQPETISVEFNRLQGGADYRVTATPIGEMGAYGTSETATSTDLRDKFNAKMGFNFHKAINEMVSMYRLTLQQVDPAQIDLLIDEGIKKIRTIMERSVLYGTSPSIDGPTDVAAISTPTSFSGRGLGSVASVFMRYYATGNNNLKVVNASFYHKISAGSEPAIVITNLPSLDELNPLFPPTVTLEFNAGLRGSSYHVLRYTTTNAQVFSPIVPTFKGYVNRAVDGNATFGNTASFYLYTTPGDVPTLTGPHPKEWPGVGVPYTDEHPDFPLVTKDTLNAEALIFKTENFDPEMVMDVRIRQLPSEDMVPQVGEGNTALWYNATTPMPIAYQQIDITPTEITVWVESSYADAWVGRSLALEFIYYQGPPGGVLDNCQGLFIEWKGDLAAAPSSPSNGWYYHNTTSDLYYIRRAGAWVQAEPMSMGRHNFTVIRPNAQIVRASTRSVLMDFDAEDPGGAVVVSLSLTLADGTTSTESTPHTEWVKEGDVLNVTAPASAGAYTFSRWEEGDGTADNWRQISTTRILSDYVVNYQTPYLRAIYI